MPVIAAPIFWAAVVGGGSALAAGKMASNAAKNAASQQTDAANHAADVQSKSAADVLAFNRQQAESDFQNSEASRRGNYDQWAAGQRRLQTLNDLLGLGPREIPDYVPGIDPNLTGSGPSGASGGTGGTGTGGGPTAPVDGSAASISAYFKSKGVSDQETPYWVGKWPELVARGKEIGNPNYAMDRLAAADVFGGAKPPTAPTKTTNAPYGGTVGAMLTPSYRRQVIAPQTPLSGGY